MKAIKMLLIMVALSLLASHAVAAACTNTIDQYAYYEISSAETAVMTDSSRANMKVSIYD